MLRRERDESVTFASIKDAGIPPILLSERFSSSDLAGLKYMDGFGELPGLPGAAEEFAQDAPGLSWALARSPGPGSWALNAVGGLLRGELSLSLYGYGCAR